MTPTQEQVREWARIAQAPLIHDIFLTASSERLAALAFTAGRESMLTELCEGVKMPEPVGEVRNKSDAYGGTFVLWKKLPEAGMLLHTAADQLREVVAREVLRERELCAKVCEEMAYTNPQRHQFAYAIRNRSNT